MKKAGKTVESGRKTKLVHGEPKRYAADKVPGGSGGKTKQSPALCRTMSVKPGPRMTMDAEATHKKS